MPSTNQVGSSEEYEASKYWDVFEEDPAKILAKNAETAIARITGIEDQQLLQAFLDVEVDRQSRSEVVAAINQRKNELNEKNQCPRGCAEPILDRFDYDEDFQIKHVNAIQYKTCIHPNENGSITVVFHDAPETEPEPAEPAAAEDDPEDATDDEGEGGDRVSEADSSDKKPEGDDDDEPDDPGMPVGENPKNIYLKLKGSDEAMTRASIKGWAGTELDLSPDETNHQLESLVNGGYVAEVTEGVFKAPPEA